MNCVRSIAVKTWGPAFEANIWKLIGKGPIWYCSARMSQRYFQLRKPSIKHFAR